MKFLNYFTHTIAFFSLTSLFGQNVVFNNTFGSNKAESAFETIKNKDGHFLTIGWTENTSNSLSDIYLIKTNSDGVKIWEKTYGLADRESGISIIELNDGGYILAGSGRSFGSGASDCLLIKIDEDGEEIWSNSYGTSLEDYVRDVILLPSGDMLLCGYTQAGNGGTDLLVFKLNNNGEILWSGAYGGVYDEEGWAMAYDNINNYYIGGWSKSTANQNSDFYLVKLSQSGSLIYEKKYGGTNSDSGLSLIYDNNKLLFAGSTLSFGNGKSDMLLYTVDPSSGDMISQSAYGSSLDDYCRTICKHEGGYYLAGYTTGYNSKGSDILIANANILGEIVSHFLILEEKDQDAWGVLSADNNNIIVTGRGVNPQRTDYDCKIIKIEVKTTSVDPTVNLNSIVIAPNPATQSFFVNGLHEPSKISLMDMVGNIILTKTYSPKEMIDLSNINNGTYLILIENNQRVFTSKLVVIK